MRSGSASWPSSTRPRSVRECGQSSQAVIFDGVTSRSFGLFIRTPVVCNRSTPNFRPKAVDPLASRKFNRPTPLEPVESDHDYAFNHEEPSGRSTRTRLSGAA